MKLWAMTCRATQDGRIMVETSDKTWSTGEGNGKPLQYSCLENPMNSMKRQKDRTLKDELPRSVHEAINSIIWFNHKFHLDWRKSNILICSIVCIIISYIVGTELSDFQIRSDQLLSRVWLCDPMNHSTPGLPVHHQPPEFTETHVHRVSDAIQPSHPLSSPSPLPPNPSQHQSLFQWVNSSHEVAKVLDFQL